MRVVMKFGSSEEIVGSLVFERSDDADQTEQVRLIFTGYSGSSEYAPVEGRDTDVVLRVFGYDQVDWADASATEKEEKEAEAEKAKTLARVQKDTEKAEAVAAGKDK